MPAPRVSGVPIVSSGGALRGNVVLDRIAAAPVPPHDELAAPAPHDGNIDRQNEKPDRNHPEADDREEAYESERHKQDTDADANRLRLRQVEMSIGKRDFGAAHVREFGLVLWQGPPQIGMEGSGRKLGRLSRVGKAGPLKRGKHLL